MGDIKKIRKKYETPRHPWNRARIDAERGYRREYGLRNKKEIWKMESLLKGFKDQIKRFPSMPTEQAIIAEEKLRGRLKRLGIISEDTPLGEVLGYDVNVIMDRRLQSVVLRKGLARTPKQARQLIIHEHITVSDKTVNAPSYLVTADEEATVQFHASSPLFREDHPERIQPEGPQRPKKGSKKQEEEAEVVAIEEGEDDE